MALTLKELDERITQITKELTGVLSLDRHLHQEDMAHLAVEFKELREATHKATADSEESDTKQGPDSIMAELERVQEKAITGALDAFWQDVASAANRCCTALGAQELSRKRRPEEAERIDMINRAIYWSGLSKNAWSLVEAALADKRKEAIKAIVALAVEGE